MAKLLFRPYVTFNADLRRLDRLNPSIIDEVRDAIDEILETGELPDEYNDYQLKRRLSGYRRSHVRDDEQPNDVLVTRYIERIRAYMFP